MNADAKLFGTRSALTAKDFRSIGNDWEIPTSDLSYDLRYISRWRLVPIDPAKVMDRDNTCLVTLFHRHALAKLVRFTGDMDRYRVELQALIVGKSVGKKTIGVDTTPDDSESDGPGGDVMDGPQTNTKTSQDETSDEKTFSFSPEFMPAETTMSFDWNHGSGHPQPVAMTTA